MCRRHGTSVAWVKEGGDNGKPVGRNLPKERAEGSKESCSFIECEEYQSIKGEQL